MEDHKLRLSSYHSTFKIGEERRGNEGVLGDFCP